ncbi:hypothetical protein HDU91_002083 [Kappamyces sp. JEL0680]|nr:hypothetical protein HDU91_002083 [Kappamyces sp. JEL0680]
MAIFPSEFNPVTVPYHIVVAVVVLGGCVAISKKHAIATIAYSVACLVMSVLFCMQLAIYLILKLIADSHLFSVNQILFVTQSAVSFALSLPLAICMLIYISKGEGNAQHQDQQFPMDAIVEPLPSYLPKEQEPPTYATTVNAAEPL